MTEKLIMIWEISAKIIEFNISKKLIPVRKVKNKIRKREK